MDLLEYEGKQLFNQHLIPVPDSVLFAGNEIEIPSWETVTVKAQVPVGKREEHGGIKIVDRENALETAKKLHESSIQGEYVSSVLLEEMIDIEEEYYLSLSIDRANKGYRLVFSHAGGSGVEERSETVATYTFYTFDTDACSNFLIENDVEAADRLVEIIARMYDLMRQEDALLVEINPLALTKEEDFVALDSKIRIDDSALYRHDYDEKETGEELDFVSLDGNIGVIGNGAGLVMATLDSIHHFGGKPANFLDIGGGADIETMKTSLETVVEQGGVDGIFINVFGGITRCDHVAQGIIDFIDEKDVTMPLVVRMVGTNQQKGKQMLQDWGIKAFDSMDDCAKSIVSETGGEHNAD